MSEDHNDRKKEYLREEYVFRINRVIDYIEKNIDQDLSLEHLAEIATFSRFHFHRIFRGMTDETLNHFINRIRLEKAAAQLILNPKKTITEVAFDCGFSGSATFARAFREMFKMSASEWRSQGRLLESKIGKTDGKIGKDTTILSSYIDGQTHNPIWRMEMEDKIQFQVEVKEVPELQVAYVRHIGPYQGDNQLFENLFEKLMIWAGPRGLLRFPETQLLSVYHDDPDITPADKQRTSVCLTVPPDTQVDGEIGKMVVPGGKFAVARFEINVDQYAAAWDAFMGGWFPESGYQPDDRLCYELYQNDPKQHPEGKHIFDICLPVKPL